MGENPFLKKTDEELEQELEDIEKTEEEPSPSDSSEDASSETEESPSDGDELFADDDAEQGDEEEVDEENADLFDDEGKTPETVPYKRLSKVIAQRNELREELASLSGRLDAVQELSTAIEDKYKDFADPVAQASFDADFMSALEQLRQQDPHIKQAVDSVMRFMDTGKHVTNDNARPNANPEPAADPRIDALIQDRARTTIVEALPDNVKQGFKSTFVDYVLGTSENLEELTAADVKSVAQKFIKEKGFTRDDVYAGKATAKRDKKPATSAQGKPAAKSQDSEDAEEPTPKAPKSMDEWKANREKLWKGALQAA